ncbi:lysozyme inhibitor LprI family protein [Achromobacter sp. DH1f]|uniref:lysozyme inhibitor LprI family protein n=1 Tax=Achromobacter sp. DH1f TaxID=1397275 RepID=UPI000A7E08BF|nr:hypothetical protein [Achromobacter sp. DH1f]
MKRYARAAGVAVVMMVAMADGAWAAASKPSFDCARAKSGAEKAICADPKLAALDVSIASRYGKARSAFDAETSRALSIEQWLFVGVRDESYEHPWVNMTGAAEIAERLGSRDKFLASLVLTPRQGFEGEWRNFGGQLKVTRQADGRLLAEASAADPYKASWVCDTYGVGEVRGDRLVIQEKDAGGWTLQLRRKGAGVVAEEVPPPGDKNGASSPNCGVNGSLGGTYFPVR